MTGRKHVLDGFKALDFTQFVAGPTVTKLMTEMGAEVIKVELTPGGDRSRGMPYMKEGRSGYFVQQNRGKLSLCVDARNPAGKAILSELIPKVDIVVENFAPGVIARMGFGYDNVRKLNPKIIMCSVSTFGQEGPLANDPGYDFIGQAYAGVTSLSGEEGGPHYPPMLAIGDVSTGVHALAAIACALLHRDRTGEGQYLDISLLDAYFHYHDVGVQALSASRGEMKPKRTGLHYPVLCPAGMFKAKGGYIFVFAWLDHHWAKLCELMGRPELARSALHRQSDSFGEPQGRNRSHREVARLVAERGSRGRRPARGANPFGPGADARKSDESSASARTPDGTADPRSRPRRDGSAGISDALFGLSASARTGRPVPRRTQRKILAEYLGYSKEQNARLGREGVIQSDTK